MYGITPLVLIILPFLFQLIYGQKAISKTIPLKFRTVILISILLQIVLSIISFNLAIYNFTESVQDRLPSCGMWMIGIYFVNLLSIIILLLIIIVQYFIKRSYAKNKQNKFV